jgi:hypothetical protein
MPFAVLLEPYGDDRSFRIDADEFAEPVLVGDTALVGRNVEQAVENNFVKLVRNGNRTRYMRVDARFLVRDIGNDNAVFEIFGENKVIHRRGTTQRQNDDQRDKDFFHREPLFLISVFVVHFHNRSSSSEAPRDASPNSS